MRGIALIVITIIPIMALLDDCSPANFSPANQVSRILGCLGETEVIEGENARLRRLRLHVGILSLPGFDIIIVLCTLALRACGASNQFYLLQAKLCGEQGEGK